jgi:fucose permease
LILILVLGTFPLWREPKVPQLSAEDSRGDAGASPQNGRREAKKTGALLSIPGVKQAVLSFFLYCSMENTIMVWAASYLVVVKQVDVATTAGRLSLFFIGITVGRAIAGLIALKAGNRTLIRGGQLMIAATIPVILFAPDGPLLIAAYVLLGLGAAPIFPCLMHQTSENFRAEDAQAIVGLQTASAFTGNAIMPLAFGFIADRLGYGIFPLLLFLTLALLIVSFESLNRTLKRGRGQDREKA